MNTRSEKMAYQTVPPRLSVVFMGSGLGPFGPPRNDDGGSCGFTTATVHTPQSITAALRMQTMTARAGPSLVQRTV